MGEITYKGGRLEPIAEEKYAWAVLVMIGDAYAPGAMVVAQSLRNVGTKYPTICMVTEDVSMEMRKNMSLVFDHVIEIPYISHKARPMHTAKQKDYYGGWLDKSFTKWNCLNFTDYDRVILVDADITFITNVDDLFDLHPPAACYSLPWALPYVKTGLVNPYIGKMKELPHGVTIPANTIMKALKMKTFVGGGFIVLLRPDAEEYKKFVSMVKENEIYAENYISTSTADEMSIAEFYARRNINWTHIHQRYAAIPWKQEWVSTDIRGYHYFGKKPWEMDPTEWPDLADWWDVAEGIISKFPHMHNIFYPVVTEVTDADAAIAQYKLASELRQLLSKIPNINAGKIRGVFNVWIMRLMKSNDQQTWSKIFRKSSIDEPLNIELIKSLSTANNEAYTRDYIANALSIVDRRIGHYPKPTKFEFKCANGAITYGSQFHMELTPKCIELIEKTNCHIFGCMAAKYSAMEPDINNILTLPKQFIIHLNTKYNVTGEAFVTPFTATLPNYTTIFGDEDAPFGSIGNFLNIEPEGDWVMLLHPSEDNIEKKILNSLSTRLQTFYIILAAASPSTLFDESPYKKATKRVCINRAHGKNGVNAIYYIMSSRDGDFTKIMDDTANKLVQTP